MQAHDITPKPVRHPWRTTLGVTAGFFIVASGALTFLYVSADERLEALRVERQELAAALASTTRQLAAEREVASSSIAELRDELADLEEDYDEERDRNEEFEDQLRRLTGTVNDLDKLSRTDEELLEKYSRVYFLNENYVPSDLDEVASRYILEGRKDQYFHAGALPFLTDLLEEAADDGIDLKVVSAYRSFDEQRDVKSGHTVVYGTGANAFSADQGYSEHQLGTTVDLTTPEVGGAYTSFAETDAYAWLQKNAYKYGFVLSYPEGNQYYVFEPWHWRFVGEDLARDLHRAEASFYDWDQRRIDEYLINVFD